MSSNNHDIDFESLVRDHYQGLYRFGFSLAKNESDAADLTQETFRIWAEKGGALRNKSKAKSWLFTTLYREFLRRRRRDRFQADVEPEQLENEMPAAEPDPARSADAHDAMEILQQVDEVYREPLALFYVEDASYKEIAEKLEIPIGTVMSRLSRGKSQLRKLMRQRME